MWANTYDLLNAGPRHRFTAFGRVVSNCGRGVQLQNLPRPSMKQKAIDSGIEALKADCADLICEKPMELMQSAVRGCLIASPGKKLVVADLSNIEGRMLAWLAGEEWKLKAFADFDTCMGEDGQWHSGDEIRAAALARQPIALKLNKKGEPIRKGHDLYALAYAKAFNITPEEVMENKEYGDGSFRQIGKVMELALGYEGGVGAFVTFALAYGIDLDAMAAGAISNIPPRIRQEAEKAHQWAEKNKRTYGLAPLTYVVCDSFKRLWREAHPAICTFWKALEQAVRTAILAPGKVFTVRSIKVVKTKAWLRIVLPSGRSLCYPAPKIDEENKISYMGINQYSRKWQRLKTYSGKLCLAKDTSVLTYRGWIPIQSVTEHDLVWDGDAWVSTGGAVCNGRKHVIEAHGAWMTPDHLVLTEKGWKSASQSGQYRRHACGLPDGYQVPRIGREEVALDSQMRLRNGKVDEPLGVQEAGKARGHRIVRVQAQDNNFSARIDTRNVTASGVRCVALDGGSLHAADAPRMGQLRRAWHNCVRFVARVVCRVLGGHGADLRARLVAGPRGQRQGLLTGELPLGDFQGAGPQHTEVAAGNDALRGAVPCGVGGAHRDRSFDPVLQVGEGSCAGGIDRPAGYDTEVFDLIDCGPRHRFVIATSTGEPLIVHNCENVTQAASRDVIAFNLPHVEAAGYEVLVTVHDEDITEAPDTPEYNPDHLASIMATNPPWAKGLPLAAAGFEAYTYRKD